MDILYTERSEGYTDKILVNFVYYHYALIGPDMINTTYSLLNI